VHPEPVQRVCRAATHRTSGDPLVLGAMLCLLLGQGSTVTNRANKYLGRVRLLGWPGWIRALYR
jgi:hypothetical protein